MFPHFSVARKAVPPTPAAPLGDRLLRKVWKRVKRPFSQKHRVKRAQPAAKTACQDPIPTPQTSASTACLRLQEEAPSLAPLVPVRYCPRGSALQDDHGVLVMEPLMEHILEVGLQSHRFADIWISILGKPHHLHRLLLSRSPFFAQLVQIHNYPHAVVEMELKDTRYLTLDSVETMFQCLYGAPIVVREEDPVAWEDDSCRERIVITAENCLSYLVTAARFCVTELRDKCISFLDRQDLQLPMETILQFVAFLQEPGMPEFLRTVVESTAMRSLCMNGYRVYGVNGIRKLSPAWIQKLLSNNAFWCPNEFARYQFAKDVCSEMELANVRNVILSSLHYSQMAYKQLHQVIQDGFLSDDRLVQILGTKTLLHLAVEGSTNAEQSHRMADWCQHESAKEPLRIGVEFPNLSSISMNQQVRSQRFYYGGSLWSVVLDRVPAPLLATPHGWNRQQKWGVFLRRERWSERWMSQHGDAYLLQPRDRRDLVPAQFQLFHSHALEGHVPIYESSVRPFEERCSWGYRSRHSIVLDPSADGQQNLRLSLVLWLVDV